MGNVVMLCACLLFVPYLCIMLIMCPCMNFGDTYSVVSFFFRHISVALVFLTWMCMGFFFVFRCSFTVFVEEKQIESRNGKKKKSVRCAAIISLGRCSYTHRRRK